MTTLRPRFTKTVSCLLAALLIAACGGDSPEKLIASGKEYLEKKDTKAAVIQLKNALQQNPNLAEARFLLGSALLDSGDIQGAEVELRKAQALHYAADSVVPLLARSMLGLNQAQKLIDEFGKTSLASGPAQSSLKSSLSAAHAILGNNERSKELLAEALVADPDNIPARLADIRSTFASRDMAGARGKLDAFLDKFPTNPEGLLLKGGLLGSEGDTAGALAQFQKAIDTNPTYVPAYAATIGSLLQAKKLDEAATQLEALKKVAPKNPRTYFLDAQFNYQRKDFKTARESIQQLLRISPNDPLTLQLAGAIEFQMRSFLQAETYLSRALQSAPRLPLARRILASIQLRSGQPAKALETLQPMMDVIDKDSNLLTLAGEAYLQSGEAKKAAEFFAKASKLDPESAGKKTSLAVAHLVQGNTDHAFQELQEISAEDKGISADLALIAAHLRNNQLDKALNAIDVLIRKQPENPASYNLKAQAQLAKKDVPAARQSLEKALTVSPTFFPAAANLARLDMVEKKPDDARKRFEAILAADAKNTQALLALAELKAATGGSADEVATLIGKAVTAAPTESAPRLALIQLHLKNKDNKKALSAANDAVAALPDKPEIVEALGKVQRLSGDLNQASTTFGKLATLQPGSPLPLMLLAETQLTSKNREEGIKSLKKALEIKPDLLEAQAILANLAMENKDNKEALRIAGTIQQQKPKEAAGYLLEGNIHATQKAWPNAIGAYRNGLRQASASSDLAIKLHGALLAADNAAEADKHAAGWIKEHPKDVAFRMYLGDLASARKNFAQAAVHYQAAQALQPNNALILNNLAWSLGQTKSPKALEYAEKANQLAPNQPAFMDTLAMLLADKGQTDKALDLLRAALKLAPQASTIQLNLAKVLVAAGRKDEARRELEALSQLGDKFSQQAEVGQLLKSL